MSEQYSKALSPIVVTLFGIWIYSNFVHPEKALYFISVMYCGNSISSTYYQPAKTNSGSYSILSGSYNLKTFIHFINGDLNPVYSPLS